MSATLHLHFAEDMPPASVEVVTPDFQTVAQVWLGPGDVKAVDVPSSDAIVQVHMPSGDTVTLHDPGRMEREISRTVIAESSGHVRSGLDAPRRRAESARAMTVLLEAEADVDVAPPAPRPTTATPVLPNGLAVGLSAGATAVEATTSDDGRGLRFEPSYGHDAFDLEVTDRHAAPGGLHVRLPGSLAALTVRLDDRSEGRVLRVEAATRHDAADTLGAYVARGDLRAAASMTSWVEQAERMLHAKGADPSAATVGAYLLLRLRRFDLMRDWARNLADRWPDLADGSVIWAWQLIQQRGDPAEIERYLLKAATGPALPVFTEGLKLLLDGLRLLGADAADHAASLNERVGVVLWESPFTACSPEGGIPGDADLHVRVGYATGRMPVESSAFASVAYDPDERTLEVEFDSGAVYAFYDVPESTYEGLVHADSVGGYFNANIQPAGYRSERLK